jgi:hypothetical protein
MKVLILSRNVSIARWVPEGTATAENPGKILLERMRVGAIPHLRRAPFLHGFGLPAARRPTIPVASGKAGLVCLVVSIDFVPALDESVQARPGSA